MNRNTRFNLLGVGCFFVLTLAACNPAATITPEPTLPVAAKPTVTLQPPTGTSAPVQTIAATAIPHSSKPADTIPARISWMKDQDSSKTAPQHQPGGGDDFMSNLYERPFSANAQDKYYPDIDIQETSLSADTDWIYVAINLKSTDPQSNTLDGQYGVEIDFNMDGRGDLLVTADKPGAEWSTDRVQAYIDNNKNVGNNTPIKSDPPQSGDGYETLVFDKGSGQDADAAWARVSPSNANVVLIAFKKTLYNNNMQFLWGAWAERLIKNPGWMDYNDHFTFVEAGSPLASVTQYYPMKALAELDNTCRWTVGFQGVGNEPGICYIPPTPTFTPLPPTETPNVTGTIQVVPTSNTTPSIVPATVVPPTEVPPTATTAG
jgi:hypothetical protein